MGGASTPSPEIVEFFLIMYIPHTRKEWKFNIIVLIVISFEFFHITCLFVC